ASAADFSATIAWGNGDASVGWVQAASGGGFVVRGRFTYLAPGDYGVLVSVLDAGGSDVDLPGTALVADAPVVGGGLPLDGAGGPAWPGPVGGFATPPPAAPAPHFPLRLPWGDGHPPAGPLANPGGGAYDVKGEPPYPEAGRSPLVVPVPSTAGVTS